MSYASESPTPNERDSSVASTSGMRARTLLHRLREGMVRFPAVMVLAGVSFVVGLLFVYGAMDALDALDASRETPLRLSLYASDLRMACLLAVPPAVAAQLACEARGRDRRFGWLVQLAAAGLAVLALMLLASAGRAFDRAALASLMAAGVALVSTCLVPWLLMDESNERTLVPQLVSAGLYTGFLSGVLLAGLCICILAASVLLFGGAGSLDRLYETALEFCTLLLAPLLLCAQLPRRGDELRVSRLYHGVVGYAILPLCLLLLVVLYGYIAKVAVTWALPSGEMNWFGSFALLVWACLWMGLRDMDLLLARWFVRWGWSLLVPVVTVQLIGVLIRLHAYGLTSVRCASLLCTGVGICGLVLSARNRGPRTLFLVMAVVAAVATLTPLNVIDVANLSQTARLRGTLGELGLVGSDGLVSQDAEAVAATDEQRERVTSAWDYLRMEERGLVGDPLVDDLRARGEDASFEELFGFERRDADGDGRSSAAQDEWRSCAFTSDASAVDVKGFAHAYDLAMADGESGGEAYGLLASDQFRLHLVWADGTELDTNLEDLVMRLMEREPTPKAGEYAQELSVPASDLTVRLADGRALVLRSVRADLEGDEVVEASVEGLLLVP